MTYASIENANQWVAYDAIVIACSDSPKCRRLGVKEVSLATEA